MNQETIAILEILVKVYFATILANIVISCIQLYDNPNRAQKVILINWLALGFSTVINGIFTENNFTSQAVTVLGTFVSQAILGSFLAEIKEVRFSWKLPFFFFLSMLGLSWVLATQVSEPDFTVYTVPSIIGGTFPFIYALFLTYRNKKSSFTTVQKLFIGTELLMTAHYFDWGYFRTHSQLILIGFIVAFAFYHVLSILIPMMANESALQVRNANLEKEVQAKVQQQKQSENINRMKDEFLAAVSHELRTPLNSIIGFSDLLKSGDIQKQEDLNEAYKIIHRSSKMQLAIVDQLLDVSSVLTGKINFNRQPVQPAQLGRDVLDEVRPMARNKGIELRSQIASNLPEIAADPVRFHQICWNLLTNALKFTSAGGWIEFQMFAQNGSLQVVVQDNGVGIQPEFLPHLFERFTQESTGHARRFGGLGLGLAICKELIQLHGGEIHAQSDGPGQGARFSFSIPISSKI